LKQEKIKFLKEDAQEEVEEEDGDEEVVKKNEFVKP